MKENKSLSIVVIILIIANIISYFTFRHTVVSVWTYLGVSIILSIGVSVLMAPKIIAENKKEKMLKTVLAGPILYFLCASFIPFGLNYITTSKEDIKTVTIDGDQVAITESTVKKRDAEKLSYTHYEYTYTYEGLEFFFSDGELEYFETLTLEISTGLFG